MTLPYEGDDIEPFPCNLTPVLPDGKCLRHTSFPEGTWFRCQHAKSGSVSEGYARRNKAQEGLWNYIPDDDEELVLETRDLRFLEALE